MAEKKKTTKKSTTAPAKKNPAAVKKTVVKKSIPAAKKPTTAGKKLTAAGKPAAHKASGTAKRPASPKVTSTTHKTAAAKTPAPGKKREETSVLKEAAMNIEESAKTVSKYASGVAKDVAERTSKVAEEVIKKTKKGISEAYDIGSKTVEDVQHNAMVYIDRFKSSVEMKNESAKRLKLTTKLGSLVFSKYQKQTLTPDQLFNEKELTDLITEIQTIDKKIIKIGKKLEKK